MVKEENDILVVDSANPDLPGPDGRTIKGDTLHLFQSCFLWDRSCHLRIRVSNFSRETAEFPLEMEFGADYADIFEVRGMRRETRGQTLPAGLRRDSVTLGYRGLDEVTRSTRLRFDPAPEALTAEQARFQVRLPPNGHAEFFLTVTSFRDGEPDPAPIAYGAAYNQLEAAFARVSGGMGRLESRNEHFNSWLDRSTADLFMMITETPEGPYPYAGIPWYSTVFGRDGIITALETLWIHPGIAAGVLRFLAARQAREMDPSRDAEPGKILHEMRRGEMANLGEIPFGLYYGTVDATPLFVYLAGRYLARTGDLELVRALWPNIEAALMWCDRHGDRDGDGYVEYGAKATNGLSQQGWKDSEDSVFHADGALATGPIALCEVQGYVYAARLEAAMMAEALGRGDMAGRLRREAESLRDRFIRDFWCPELGTYALALDGAKRPCRVRSSNAGQCLFTGIAEEHHARRIADMLVSEDMFTGFGVRTIACGEPRYNPMSYHNGSVWPHDNALIALGLGRYGHRAAAGRILEGLFQASLFVDQHRLPELFCGFIRRTGEGPTLYPVACNPQAWASASVYMLLEACLGIRVDARAQRIVFHNPVLPPFLSDLRIRGLRAGAGSVDLTLRRHSEDVTIEIARRDGKIEIVETR